VYGEFCAYDPSMNRKDPSSYATVSALMGESEHCGEHRYTMPLGMVVDAVRGGGGKKGTTTGSAMRPLPSRGGDCCYTDNMFHIKATTKVIIIRPYRQQPF
jgi:hypothetical protein